MKTVRANGFTLVELIIALSVLSIIISVAAPPLTQFLQESRVKQNASNFMASIMLARSEAITRNRTVSLCKIDSSDLETCDATASWQSGWIAFEDIDGDGMRDVGDEIVNTQPAFDAGLVITTPAEFDNFVSFLPSGDVNSLGSFTLCSAGKAKTLVINATGRPRVVDAVCP